MAVGDGAGTTITFGTSGFTANIISVDGPGPEADEIDTTHLGTTTAKTNLAADLYDPGEVTLTVQHDASLTVPVGGSVETVTIDWAGDGDTWAFDGWCKSYSAGAAVGELMTASMVVRASGEITGL